MRCSSGCTWPTRGASGATRRARRDRRSGPTATSWRCWSPKKSRSASRPASSGSRAGRSFPFLKTIDDFDFTYQSTVRLALLGSALSPDFVTEGRCLILYGKPGRGKTHLAVAIAYRAIQNGFDALFVTAAELIDDLSAAFRAGPARRGARHATPIPALLVVDEVGYLTYGTDAANMLFHVVNDRHRRKRAMIFTTNKATRRLGPRAARRGSRAGHRRSHPRARPPAHARRAVDAHQAPRP